MPFHGADRILVSACLVGFLPDLEDFIGVRDVMDGLSRDFLDAGDGISRSLGNLAYIFIASSILVHFFVKRRVILPFVGEVVVPENGELEIEELVARNIIDGGNKNWVIFKFLSYKVFSFRDFFPV